MRSQLLTALIAVAVLVCVTSGFAVNQPVKLVDAPRPAAGITSHGEPYVIVQQGDTVWVTVHSDTTRCPGDEWQTHGGEATGGPDGSETWCFEGAWGDSCGTNPPWDTNCFKHMFVTDGNHWHVDTSRTSQRDYCGYHALWCGDTLVGGAGYGNYWDCIAHLTLPGEFDLADGCSLMFDVRYDTECKHDFLCVDVRDEGGWQRLATFNATSDNPGTECGGQTGGSPDFWGNSDVNRLTNCNWQSRGIWHVPAFHCYIPPGPTACVMTTWSRLAPPAHPEGRFDAGISYDSARDRVVIFGGCDSYLGDYFGDTWEYDGTTWTERSWIPHSPSPRGGCQMVYDEARTVTVLFGGMFEGAPFDSGDTWTWNGYDWTRRYPTHSPEPRFGHGMAYDSARGRVVLFGGHADTGCVNDTWEWDGTDWTECSPAHRPPARYFLAGNALAYDSHRGVVTMFGGSNRGITFFEDTWEWDGTDWVEKHPAHHPSARDAHALAYSPCLERVVLFGGNSQYTFQNDTWEWDGGDWLERSPISRPRQRHRHSMVFDTLRERIFLFGGWADFGEYGLYDTWQAAYLGLDSHPLEFRWRFVSDGAWSDHDGHDTEGGAFIDNVTVVAGANAFTDDFESGTADPAYWAFPLDETGEFFGDGWHLKHDPDPPYEGGDGGARSTCLLDSSWTWRARPDRGFPSGAPWRNGWHYRLQSPTVPMLNTGCVVQYDQFVCFNDYTCDYADTKVRFHTPSAGWDCWIDIDGYLLQGGCYFWDIDKEEDVTPFHESSADSVQFAWDMLDISQVGDPCRGKHKDSDIQIDNVSVGFFDGSATVFAVRAVDMLHDSFLEGVAQGYNAFFDANDPDTVARYSGAGAAPMPKPKQLRIDCSDRDGLGQVDIFGSINGGATWTIRPMTLDVPNVIGHPELGGEYIGTLTAGDFTPGGTAWARGTDCWYFVRATDSIDNVEYFPARANPNHPDHEGTRNDYLAFSILPAYPPYYTGPRILLVDGYGGMVYDHVPCLSALDTRRAIDSIYELVLDEAGYRYPCDTYDIAGADGRVHIHPTDFSAYDAVIWLTGPNMSKYLFDREAQVGLKEYLAQGGNLVLCGDRIAWAMTPVAAGGGGQDSLDGEFMSGVLGCTYECEVQQMFAPPYVYLHGTPILNVLGRAVPVPIDSMIVFIGCPESRDMSCVATTEAPWPGYAAQKLFGAWGWFDPPCSGNDAGAIYTEYMETGQCVFLNFDLSASLTEMSRYCDGNPPDPAPDFIPGYYHGRVALLRFILWDIFGLPVEASAGVSEINDDRAAFSWDLLQNTPNPCLSSTEIKFEVACRGRVSIKVYNTAGQLVKVLKDEHMMPGHYSVAWDGRSRAGQRVAGGVYFYRMTAGQFSTARKVIVIGN